MLGGLFLSSVMPKTWPRLAALQVLAVIANSLWNMGAHQVVPVPGEFTAGSRKSTTATQKPVALKPEKKVTAPSPHSRGRCAWGKPLGQNCAGAGPARHAAAARAAA